LADQYALTKAVNEQFDCEEVPTFLMGHSLGGLLTLELAASEYKDNYKGMTLLAPLIGLEDPVKIQKLLPFSKFLNLFLPTYQLVLPGAKPQAWSANWSSDPLEQGGKICPHNVVFSASVMDKLQTQTLKKADLPFLMVLAGKEDAVCNDTARSFYETSKQEKKELIMYDSCCHRGVTSDREYWPLISKDTIRWMNMIA